MSFAAHAAPGGASMPAILETSVPGARLLHQGKVRDVYEVPDPKGGAPLLMLVATDRLSAFDVVMREPIPDKGKVLTRISNFWFEKFRHLVPHHVISTSVRGFIDDEESVRQLEGRAMICRKAKPLAIEAIVRGYLVGSGWKEYRKKGTVCDLALPAGLRLASKLPAPLFTPSTKAARGAHDENISPARAGEIIGAALAARVAEISVRLYQAGADYAASRGIILADTKFEFGLIDGELILIDELLTPDSSRFWPADEWREGENPPSFDKQFVRDWLEASGWNKVPPPPALPAEIIEKTAAKYREAYERLTGERWR